MRTIRHFSWIGAVHTRSLRTTKICTKTPWWQLNLMINTWKHLSLTARRCACSANKILSWKSAPKELTGCGGRSSWPTNTKTRREHKSNLTKFSSSCSEPKRSNSSWKTRLKSQRLNNAFQISKSRWECQVHKQLTTSRGWRKSFGKISASLMFPKLFCVALLMNCLRTLSCWALDFRTKGRRSKNTSKSMEEQTRSLESRLVIFLCRTQLWKRR